MKTKFRILLLDDNKDVLELLKATLDQDIKVENLSIRIEVETLHIVLEQLPNGLEYQVTEQTIFKLGELCNEEFDYIFSDFTFIGDSNKNEDLRAALLAGNRGVDKADMQGFVLQLKDIKNKFNEMIGAGRFNTNELIPAGDGIKARFIGHAGSVLVYTNSPKPFDNYFDMNQMPIRRNEVQNVFSNASVEPFILMHNEFSITPELDAMFKSVGERKTYYSSLLSKKIESLMHYAALRHMVTAQSKLRFSNTRKAFQALTAFGIGFGALVALFGEVIYHLIHRTASLTGERYLHIIDADKNILINLVVLLSMMILSWYVFPLFGVRIAKRTEAEIDRLI